MKQSFLKATLIVLIVFLVGRLYGTPITKEINNGWKFKQASLTNWYQATVPGTVHTDLLDNKIIEDPFYRMNERGLQWIDKEDWVYETTFDLSPEMFIKNNIRMCFKGLDTYADVYLNDNKILEANNMFRQWNVEVKNTLKKSKNVIKIYFHSPIKINMPKWDAFPFQYKAENDQSENGGLFNKKLSVFTRKAGYQYGWDWGPRFVTSGIWRPIVLEAWDNVRIDNIHFIQEKVNKQSATVKTVVEVLSDTTISSVILSVEDVSANKVVGSVNTFLKKGLNKLELNFTISNPKLWWCNGLGEAYLYDFKTTLNDKSNVIDFCNSKIGIRSLKLVTTPDKIGSTFHFELNGFPVFAKGANYIPCDNFLPRVTKSIYEKTILDAVSANMNMLRVWGGGIYEDDYFYELCDKYGIMIWQDFMFACSLYPFEGEFAENVRQEAIDNVKRLRNHPAIALWCGNNECNEAWFTWGWKEYYEKLNPEYARKIWQQYCNEYDVVLPQVISEYSRGTAYRPSSPFSIKNGKSNSFVGDNHYWKIWGAEAPITDYNVVRSRFFSEYGFQSFPEFESVKKYNPYEKDWDINSDIMMFHQRGGNNANNRIKSYLLKEYRDPKNFESFLYMNLILQGDAIKTAIEAHRRDKPYCMGTIFWQLNDCWPVASWSSRDYYGRWKAQHYFTRKAYKDILVSPIEKNNVLDLFVVSDRLQDTKAKLILKLIDFNGVIVSFYSKSINVVANTSKKVFSVPINELLKDKKRNEVVLHATLETKDGKIYDNNYFLANQKDIKYPIATIQRSVKVIEGGFEVTLNSEKFARGVFLSIDGINNFFENNYFDLLPNVRVTIKVQANIPLNEFERQLKIVYMADAY